MDDGTSGCHCRPSASTRHEMRCMVASDYQCTHCINRLYIPATNKHSLVTVEPTQCKANVKHNQHTNHRHISSFLPQQPQPQPQPQPTQPTQPTHVQDEYQCNISGVSCSCVLGITGTRTSTSIREYALSIQHNQLPSTGRHPNNLVGCMGCCRCVSSLVVGYS
jgi:hypothetical protein